MQINLIKQNNDREIIIHDDNNNPINFFADRDDPKNNIIIHIGDKDNDLSKEVKLVHKKKDIEIICTREGEKKQLRDYMKMREKESRDMQVYLKMSQVFYHNFMFDVKVKDEVKKEAGEERDKAVKIPEPVKVQPKRMVKNYD
jgi:hypothetical protein